MTENQSFWYKVARTIAKAGSNPVPISDTFIEILQILMNEEQGRFVIKVFKKPSLRFDQIKERIKGEYDDEAINKMLEDLLDGGILSSGMSQSAGVRVYRLLQPWPGLMEYCLLRGETDEKAVKLAKLWHRFYEEMVEGTQKNIDMIVKMFEKAPAIDRIVPVEQEVEFGSEIITPYEQASQYIENYDDIAVAHCYCRHEKELIGDPCSLEAPKYNCFFFDKSAKHIIDHNFGERISKEDAKKKFKEAEDYGLVHKVFHVHANPEGKIEAICNCCKCCCGPFQLYHMGAIPLNTLTSYIAKVNDDECIGCETCVEKCPVDAIDIEDAIAQVNDKICIGCGVCAHACPQDPKALYMERTGLRKVVIVPKKVSQT